MQLANFGLTQWHDNTWYPPPNSAEAVEAHTASAAFNGEFPSFVAAFHAKF
jgi:hypothetical protein